MLPDFRTSLPYVALALVIGAVAWAVSFGTLPPADFTFINGTEIESVDPAVVTGSPEGRIIDELFEGLFHNLPAEMSPDFDASREDPQELKPQPAVAKSCQISEDGKTYTFQIRRSARWSNGTPVTAHDFVWSWQRFLHPEVAAQYAYLLGDYVRGASAYNKGTVHTGDRVDVELKTRKWPHQPYPQGTLVTGILREIIKGEPPSVEASDPTAQDQLANWKDEWVYLVEADSSESRGVAGTENPNRLEAYCKSATSTPSFGGETIACHHVLPDFDETVGIRATDDHTLEVTLNHATPYFLQLCAFYPLYPVNQTCVETFGYPAWTKAENIVNNGPFRMEFRRIRDRIRLVKNPQYWNADTVKIQSIDALAVTSETTVLNMYLHGQTDWATTVPAAMIPDLSKRDDWLSDVFLGIYFYRLNVKHPVLSDVRVRQALNLAVNRQELCDNVTRAGERPAWTFCPSGIPGYTAPAGLEYNVSRAKQLLAEAGYPDGRGFPQLELLYNTSESHKTIAEVIQQQWSRNLGIKVTPKNREWGVFLNDVDNLNYHISRLGWIGDYVDPNTFLDLFVTDGANNSTGWSNPEYDRLLEQSRAEPDPGKRFEILRQAEEILLSELPIIPIYFYVSKNLVKPHVRGIHSNLRDIHPLHIIDVDPLAKKAGR
jgi:oligopeptide transport system substrate-binding protein